MKKSKVPTLFDIAGSPTNPNVIRDDIKPMKKVKRMMTLNLVAAYEREQAEKEEAKEKQRELTLNGNDSVGDHGFDDGWTPDIDIATPPRHDSSSANSDNEGTLLLLKLL